MSSTKNIMQVDYHLHNDTANNMVTILDDSGHTYAISHQGKAYLLEGEEYFPLQSNPFPFTTIKAKIFTYLPRVVLAATGLAAFILLIYFTVMADCPSCQEAFLNAAAFWGWITQLAFSIAFTVLLVACMIWQFGKGIKLTQNPSVDDAYFEEQSNVGVLCLVASRHEHDRTIEERLRIALAQLSDEYSPVVAIAVLRFGDPVAYLYTQSENDPRMDRCAPKNIEMPDYAHTTFVAENWEQFEAYCKEFYVKTKEFILKKEHRKAGRLSDTTQNHFSLLRKSITVFILCCFVATAYAQKSKRVEDYLGTDRYTMDKPVGVVRFIFSNAVLERTGDGLFTYKQLLPNTRFYTDEDNAGKLINITVGKDRVFPVRPDETPAAAPIPVNTPVPSADPVRPRPLFAEQSEQPSRGFILPDSADLAKSLHDAQTQIETGKKHIVAAGKSVWELVMWFFFQFIGLLIGVVGFCRYIAKTASKESAMNTKGRTIVGGWIMSAQQNAAGLSLVITWFIAAFVLLDIFFMLLALALPVWILLIIWFPVLWVAEKLTDWVVVNPKMIGKGKEYKP
jgi:hypothetical protein